MSLPYQDDMNLSYTRNVPTAWSQAEDNEVMTRLYAGPCQRQHGHHQQLYRLSSHQRSGGQLTMSESSLVPLIAVLLAGTGIALVSATAFSALGLQPGNTLNVAQLHRYMSWFAALIAAIGLYFGVLHLSGNVHTVVAGELYRSGQISPRMIRHLQKTYGIKTIINLRGENIGKPWYDREVEVSRRLGITHRDFRMSMKRALTLTQTSALVEMMRTAEKPILIHCQGGADRTGLASALYLGAVTGSPIDHAEGQLSIRFGHLAIPHVSRAIAMDRSWDMYAETLDQSRPRAEKTTLLAPANAPALHEQLAFN